jgi:[acyl-carrier-protein] S-malonyltransferase
MALALVFPGQGSQSVGMLAALAAEQPEVERTFAEASHVLGYDLWQLCQQGPEAELARTERTQPAMLAAGVACFRAWRAHAGPLPVAMAGHSLGEYTALVCSGALEFPTAVALVQERGRLMQAAVPEGSGAMAAILGLDDDAAIAACAEAAQGEVVEAAKARGAKRAVTLPVSVPSHSALMRGAARQLGERLASTPLRLPQVPDVYTVDLARHASVEGIRGALEAQLYRPVRWTETIRAMLDRGITTIVECGPGKVLTSLDDPKSLAQALQACRERMHG